MAFCAFSEQVRPQNLFLSLFSKVKKSDNSTDRLCHDKLRSFLEKLSASFTDMSTQWPYLSARMALTKHKSFGLIGTSMGLAKRTRCSSALKGPNLNSTATTAQEQVIKEIDKLVYYIHRILSSVVKSILSSNSWLVSWNNFQKAQK